FGSSGFGRILRIGRLHIQTQGEYMKNIVIGIGSVLLFSFAAVAEENAPRMETFLGYTFTRANSATNIPAFSANGGSGQFVYNFHKWISAVADVGAVHNGNIR